MRQSDVRDSARGRQAFFPKSRKVIEGALTKQVAKRSAKLRRTQDGRGQIDSPRGESIFVTWSPKIYHEARCGAQRTYCGTLEPAMPSKGYPLVPPKEGYAEVDQTYGSRRMSDALKDKGFDIGRQKARSLMREAGIVAVCPKKRHVYPKAGQESRTAENHLNREFETERPNQKWVGDITYLWTATGWIYLAVVLDLFSPSRGSTDRKVVGWAVSANPDTHLVLAALNQAVILRHITPETALLFHSDQGCQYTSHAYQYRLSDLGIKASMSRRGNCWDNAVMERFFRSLKTESISRDRHQNQEEIGWSVNKYIHFYNNKRIHSTIGGTSPNNYEQQLIKSA